jgi:hypothetical protein
MFESATGPRTEYSLTRREDPSKRQNKTFEVQIPWSRTLVRDMHSLVLEEVVVIELVLLLLDPGPLLSTLDTDVAATIRPAPILCDDRSPLIKPDGSVNWDCEIDGCSPSAPVCWSERLDFCFIDGEDTGECVWDPTAVMTCNGWWSCLKLWAGCDGVYECNESSGVGCGSGSCTPVPALNPTPGAACADQTCADTSAPVRRGTAALNLCDAGDTVTSVVSWGSVGDV